MTERVSGPRRHARTGSSGCRLAWCRKTRCLDTSGQAGCLQDEPPEQVRGLRPRGWQARLRRPPERGRKRRSAPGLRRKQTLPGGLQSADEMKILSRAVPPARCGPSCSRTTIPLRISERSPLRQPAVTTPGEAFADDLHASGTCAKTDEKLSTQGQRCQSCTPRTGHERAQRIASRRVLRDAWLLMNCLTL